ncbi:MAG: monovalent cation/H(+) antiporter subunit G [Caldilineaceae bacterium]
MKVDSMAELLTLGFMLGGVLLMLIAALGLVRMPDLFLRISVSSKGATLGVALLMLAAALYFNDLGVTSRALAVIVFTFLTAPVAAHMMGRAGYKDGAAFWERTSIDRRYGSFRFTKAPVTEE